MKLERIVVTDLTPEEARRAAGTLSSPPKRRRPGQDDDHERRLRLVARKFEQIDGFVKRVNRLEGEPVVGAAVADGRIAADMRETWLRLFEDDPDATKSVLDDLSADAAQATRNRSADLVDDDAYAAQFAARFGGHAA